MILGYICYIFAILGIAGFLKDNLTFAYISLVLCIIQSIVGIVSAQQRGCVTEWITLFCAIGMTIGGNEFLPSLAICFCFEEVILFSLSLFLMIFIGIASFISFLFKPKEQSEKIDSNPSETWDEYVSRTFQTHGTRTYSKDIRLSSSDDDYEKKFFEELKRKNDEYDKEKNESK